MSGDPIRKNWRFLAAGLLLALLLAAVVSPWASPAPDGLERVAEDLEFLPGEDEVSVWDRSPLPDYEAPGVGHPFLATGLAGVAGTVAVFALGWGLAALLRRRRRDEAGAARVS